MAVPFFKSFRSTVTPFLVRAWTRVNLLVDPITGAPTGIQNWNDNGADGIWTPIDVTIAQLGAPTAAMLADLNAVYRLNVPPYSRYISNGTAIVAQNGSDLITNNIILYAPWTVTDPAGYTVTGTVKVINYPA
jgi:hypothetical protein